MIHKHTSMLVEGMNCVWLLQRVKRGFDGDPGFRTYRQGVAKSADFSRMVTDSPNLTFAFLSRFVSRFQYKNQIEAIYYHSREKADFNPVSESP